MGMASALQAQDRLYTTRVFTEPQGARFFVDGVPYKSAQVFQWPQGSKHTLLVDQEAVPFPGTRLKFSSWSDSTGNLSLTSDTLIVTAGPSVTFIKATYTTEYLVRVLFNSCTPGECNPPGSVSIGGGPSTTDVEQWMSAGSVLLLQAFPNTGFVFNGWGPPSNYSTNYTYQHTVVGPVVFANIFAPAKRVTLLSDPPNLLLAPDRTPTRSPAEMDWGVNTRHVLGVVTPQTEVLNGSITWVFSRWSNGGGMNEVYVAGNTTTPDTLTAHFVRGVGVSFVTNPPGLKVRIEGRDNWPAYNFMWGVGLKYQISAPAEQTDSRGRRYVFKGWSNDGPAAQEITILPEHVATGFRLTANYEPQNRLSITTDPAGLPIMVDGVECHTNCIYDRAPGAHLRISAPGTIPLSDTSRLEFTGWSDGADPNRTYVFDERVQTSLVANFKGMFRLVTLAEPGNGASFRVDPVSRDGFYDSSASVVVTAEDKPGYRFKRWEGDLSGPYRTGSVTMNVPRIARAIFDSVPYADPAGVRNAAGETPEVVVAPGSIASIYGVNLAGAYEAGPQAPLSQAIGGVTVRIGTRLLPLLFVSPEQINFVVPSDLEEGTYPVSVGWDRNPEVNTQMRVARNAPGLFQKAFRESGEEITPLAPAKGGDLVVMYGTGFGPYQRSAIEGFPLPAQPAYPLLDTVQVLIGETAVDAIWAGGAPGQIGTALVRFELPAELTPVDGALSLRVRINGRVSNTVSLKVQ